MLSLILYGLCIVVYLALLVYVRRAPQKPQPPTISEVPANSAHQPQISLPNETGLQSHGFRPSYKKNLTIEIPDSTKNNSRKMFELDSKVKFVEDYFKVSLLHRSSAFQFLSATHRRKVFLRLPGSTLGSSLSVLR